MNQDSFHKSNRKHITSNHLLYLLVIIVSVLGALAQLVLPFKFGIVFILVIPAILIVILILRNPMLGIFFYYIYEYLRPYDIIPALSALRLAMVIEIVTLISWIFWIAIHKEKIKWTNINSFYLLFVGIIAIGVFFALNNRYAFDFFQIMVVYFIIYLIATNTVNSFARLEKLVWVLLVIHFYLALKGVINFVIGTPLGTSGVVASGFFGDENDYALTINVFIPFAYFYFLKYDSIIKKLILITFLVSSVLAVVSSFSRGGWVGLIVVTIVCVSLSKKKIAAISLILFLTIPLIMFAPVKYWDEIKTISNTSENTADARLTYWESAFYMYLDHPIIGVGAGNGKVWLPKYFVGSRDSNTQWGRAFHGTIPQVMAELGTIGLSLYLLIIFLLLRNMFKVRKESNYGHHYHVSEVFANSIIGSVAGYFASATFLSTAYYPQFWTICTLGMITYFCKFHNPKEKDSLHNKSLLVTLEK